MRRTPLGWYRHIVRRYVPGPRRTFEYPINRYYAHRLDPILTWLFDQLRFSPNAVTAVSLGIGLMAAVCNFSGRFLTAAILLQLHHLFDGVDGNLARYHNCCSEFGKWFDILTDQIVRFALFVSLAIVANVPQWLAWGMLATIYLDIAVVTLIVTPYAKRRPLIRSHWKQWFMDRGLMPGFDIFSIYFIVSICLIYGSPETALVLVTLLKTLDWGYRVWECIITASYQALS